MRHTWPSAGLHVDESAHSQGHLGAGLPCAGPSLVAAGALDAQRESSGRGAPRARGHLPRRHALQLPVYRLRQPRRQVAPPTGNGAPSSFQAPGMWRQPEAPTDPQAVPVLTGPWQWTPRGVKGNKGHHLNGEHGRGV